MKFSQKVNPGITGAETQIAMQRLWTFQDGVQYDVPKWQ